MQYAWVILDPHPKCDSIGSKMEKYIDLQLDG